MSLADFLKTSKDLEKKPVEEEITLEERIEKNMTYIRRSIAYWRVYPDKLIDFYCSLNPNNTFKFFFYQRLFLRAVMRHKYVYATFVRAWSKSFMSIMSLMLQAILYPGAKLFVVSGGKERDRLLPYLATNR